MMLVEAEPPPPPDGPPSTEPGGRSLLYDDADVDAVMEECGCCEPTDDDDMLLCCCDEATPTDEDEADDSICCVASRENMMEVAHWIDWCRVCVLLLLSVCSYRCCFSLSFEGGGWIWLAGVWFCTRSTPASSFETFFAPFSRCVKLGQSGRSRDTLSKLSNRGSFCKWAIINEMRGSQPARHDSTPNKRQQQKVCKKWLSMICYVFVVVFAYLPSGNVRGNGADVDDRWILPDTNPAW